MIKNRSNLGKDKFCFWLILSKQRNYWILQRGPNMDNTIIEFFLKLLLMHEILNLQNMCNYF